ncbi:MAG: DUF1540 domain-containing protein [Christensenellales bacterium]
MSNQAPQVVCKAKSCIHNIATSCNALQLLIVGDRADSSSQTRCRSYVDDIGSYTNNAIQRMKTISPGKLGNGLAMSMSEIGEFDAPDTIIACTVRQCRHNKDWNCRARTLHVSQAEKLDNAHCESFKPL